MLNTVKKIWNDESGATAIEYGLIAALISIFAIGAMQAIGTSLDTAFGTVSTSLGGAVDGGAAGGGAAADDGGAAAADGGAADGGAAADGG